MGGKVMRAIINSIALRLGYVPAEEVRKIEITLKGTIDYMVKRSEELTLHIRSRDYEIKWREEEMRRLEGELHYAGQRADDMDQRLENAYHEIKAWQSRYEAVSKIVTDVYARLPMPPIVITKNKEQ
jgi:chromosome segregation ATPase